MDEIVKVCKVHGDITVDQAYRKKSILYKKEYFACKMCGIESSMKYKNKNKIKVILFNKNYREKNKDKCKSSQLNWKKNNKDKLKKACDAWKKKNKNKVTMYFKRYIENMNDAYICKLLKKGSLLESKDIPKDLIDLKREQLKLIRLVKEKINGNNNS